jgi:hypothetical protein
MTKTNLAPLRACVLQARAINAQVHVAQHSHDWPTGDIVGRTEGGWLVYHDGETSQTRVLFADWLNTSQA